MPFWRIWPADPLGLRPHVNRRHLAWGAAAILGGLLLVVILVAATDPDDRGAGLRRALYERITYSSEIADWSRRHAREEIVDIDPITGHTIRQPYLPALEIRWVDVPPRHWWERLLPSQPFRGRVHLSAVDRTGACRDLVLDFKAFLGWRDVGTHSYVRGRSYSSGGTTRRPEYSITELSVPSD